MPIDYPALGKRIAFFRNQSHLTQEYFAYEVSTSDTEVHRLLIDCNELEAEILTRTLKELRAILYSLGV